MADPRIPLKNPYLAAILAFLLPGSGHLYQGRTFKGVLYGICIIGTFTYGMFLSDWTALYAGNPVSSSGRRWGFIAQMPLGTPAIFALVQQRRYLSPSNVPQTGLEEPISAPFRGRLRIGNFENQNGMEMSQAISETIKSIEEAYWKALREGRSKVKLKMGKDEDYPVYEVEGRIELHPTQTDFGPAVEGRFAGHVMMWNPENGDVRKNRQTN